MVIGYMEEFKYSKESRTVILQAAKMEFSEKGYDGARLSLIAKRAGVNQALIHYYFSNKEKLYHEVLQYLFHHEEISIIREHLKDVTLNPKEALFTAIYILVYLHHNAIDPEINKIISWELAQGGDKFKMLLTDYMLPKLNMLSQVIQEGIESGDFETDDPFLVVFNLTNMVLSFENSKQYLKDTPWYDRFYGGDNGKKLFEFALKSTFKSLAPKHKACDIPHINEDLQHKLEEIMQELKNNSEHEK